MKKLISIIAFMYLTLSLVSCGSKNLLQEVTNTTKKQSIFIEKVLDEQLSVKYKHIEKACQEDYIILEGMDDDLEAYTIISEKDEKYLLILRTSNKDIICAFDENNDLAFGIVGNEIPKYFEIHPLPSNLVY